MKKIIVAIDGYSSCGKSTMAKQLASETGYLYIDSGAMYRGVAWYAIQKGWVTPSGLNTEAINAHVAQIHVEFISIKEGVYSLFVDGTNVDEAIRSLSVSDAASRISVLSSVRAELVRQQQLMGVQKGIVMDGRDIGTVVFPNAELKIFLTATPEIRAQRRMSELVLKGENVSYSHVLAHIIERDERDQNRLESPLKLAHDAIVIDNTLLTFEQQQDTLRQLFNNKVKALN